MKTTAPAIAAVERIHVAAESCFRRAGYAATSMREIAEAAGVSKSLLHYHYQSKEQLFVEVQLAAYERLAARVCAAVAELGTGTERGLAALDVLCAALREGDDYAAQAEILGRALADDALRQHVVHLRTELRQLLARTLERLLGAEGARLPVSPEVAADLLWAVLSGLGMQSALGDPPERVARALQGIRSLAALALGTKGDRA